MCFLSLPLAGSSAFGLFRLGLSHPSPEGILYLILYGGIWGDVFSRRRSQLPRSRDAGDGMAILALDVLPALGAPFEYYLNS